VNSSLSMVFYELMSRVEWGVAVWLQIVYLFLNKYVATLKPPGKIGDTSSWLNSGGKERKHEM
jgi:hypothetical protein